MTQTLEATSKGLTDIGHSMDGFESGRMPEFLMGSLPMLFDDYFQFNEFRKQMAPDLKAYFLEKWDVVLIANAPMIEQSLFLTEPIKSLADLKGKKIRVLSEAESKFFEKLGAVPVSMPFPELYGAMDRGVLDGMTMYHMALLDLKYHEVVKHVPIRLVRVNWDMVFMHKDVWDSLPKEWQQVIKDLEEPYLQFAMNDLKTLYNESKVEAEKLGVDFTPLPAAEMKKATEIAVPIWEEYASKYGQIAQKGFKIALEAAGK